MITRPLTDEQHVTALKNLGDMEVAGVFDMQGELLAVAWGATEEEAAAKIRRVHRSFDLDGEARR